jgi:hypothetical protein
MLEQLNSALAKPRVEDLLAAGMQLESGECVKRNEVSASEFFAYAARLGSPEGMRRIAVLFGSGRGVPQSYANAGAWLAGKGASDESIEPWDYSVGYAFTLVATTLDQVRFPKQGWPIGLEVTLVVEASAQRPRSVEWQFTGGAPAQAEALRSALASAFDAAAAEAMGRLKPADPKYIVAARVAVPIAIRRYGDERFAVTLQDPVLR